MAKRNSTSTRDGKAGNFPEKRSNKKSANGSSFDGRISKAGASSTLRDTAATGSTADKKMLRAWETISRNRGEAA